MKNVVSIHVAKLAQKVGFDEPCHWFYLVDNEGEPEQFEWGMERENSSIKFISSCEIECTAPTYEQLRSWISETKHIEFYAAYDFSMKNWYGVVNDHIVHDISTSRHEVYDRCLQLILENILKQCQSNNQ